MEHFNSPYLSIHWNEKIPCVMMEWKKFVKGSAFRGGLDKGLELLISKGTSRWLADLRSLQVLDQKDQEWSNEDWFPRAIAGGIRYMAIVVPLDVLAEMSVNRIMERVKNTNLTVHYFSVLGEAESWLKQFKD